MEDEFGHLSKFGCIEISNGICWLAASVREKGHTTGIVDALPLRMNNAALTAEIAGKEPRYVGISACTMDIDASAALAEMLKKAIPGVITVIGGPHITALPEETMSKFPAFDIGVIGEGEMTITDLLDKVKEGGRKGLPAVDGLIYRDGEKLVTTKPRKFIRDLDTLPLPAWDLLPDLKKFYFAPAWTKHSGNTTTIITSRGCPFQCIYCDRKVFGNRARYHSAKYVLEMIKTLYGGHGIRHFRIGDDNFMMNKDLLIEICGLIIAEKLDISWSCLARADSIGPDVLSKMKKAGCWSIAFGVETGSQEIHDIEKKGIRLEQIAKAVALTRKAGIKTISFNIIGHPKETVETIKATINFNKAIKVDDFKTQFMTPFPGTELYREADKYGVFDRDWKKMGVFKDPIFVPFGLTKEEMIRWNKEGFRSFYMQPRVILSYLLGIRSLAEVKMLMAGGFTMIGWKIRELFTRRA